MEYEFARRWNVAGCMPYLKLGLRLDAPAAILGRVFLEGLHENT
jgi:hypothetical protein